MKIRTPAYVDDIEATPLDKGLPRPAAGPGRRRRAGTGRGTPRLRFVARLSNYTDEIPVLADAVDPVSGRARVQGGAAVSDGTWLGRAAPHSVVIGAELARELKVEPGDTILVSAQTVNDTTNADEYTVAGLVAAPTPEVNRGGLFMSLDDARELLAAPSGPNGLVTEVDVALPRAASLNAALAQGDAAAAAPARRAARRARGPDQPARRGLPLRAQQQVEDVA